MCIEEIEFWVEDADRHILRGCGCLYSDLNQERNSIDQIGFSIQILACID